MRIEDKLDILADAAKSFTDQPEYFETYPDGLSNREFIRRIYENLFGRAPDDPSLPTVIP